MVDKARLDYAGKPERKFTLRDHFAGILMMYICTSVILLFPFFVERGLEHPDTQPDRELLHHTERLLDSYSAKIARLEKDNDPYLPGWIEQYERTERRRDALRQKLENVDARTELRKTVGRILIGYFLLLALLLIGFFIAWKEPPRVLAIPFLFLFVIGFSVAVFVNHDHPVIIVGLSTAIPMMVIFCYRFFWNPPRESRRKRIDGVEATDVPPGDSSAPA